MYVECNLHKASRCILANFRERLKVPFHGSDRGSNPRGDATSRPKHEKPPQGGFFVWWPCVARRRDARRQRSALEAGAAGNFRHPLAPSPDNARNTSPREWAARMGQAGCNHSPGCADVDRPSPCHCMPRCRRAVPAGSGWCGTASLRLTDEGGGVSRDGMSAWTSRTRYRPLRARARQHRASGLERTNTRTHA